MRHINGIISSSTCAWRRHSAPPHLQAQKHNIIKRVIHICLIHLYLWIIHASFRIIHIIHTLSYSFLFHIQINFIQFGFIWFGLVSQKGRRQAGSEVRACTMLLLLLGRRGRGHLPCHYSSLSSEQTRKMIEKESKGNLHCMA